MQSRAATADGSGGTSILIIGEIDRWPESAPLIPDAGSVKYADFQNVTFRFLHRENPGIVLSPLLCHSFDCLDLAIVLQDAGFRGIYRVVCEALPDPTLVRREVRARCPGLDFDVIVLEPASPRPLARATLQ